MNPRWKLSIWQWYKLSNMLALNPFWLDHGCTFLVRYFKAISSLVSYAAESTGTDTGVLLNVWYLNIVKTGFKNYLFDIETKHWYCSLFSPISRQQRDEWQERKHRHLEAILLDNTTTQYRNIVDSYITS